MHSHTGKAAPPAPWRSVSTALLLVAAATAASAGLDRHVSLTSQAMVYLVAVVWHRLGVMRRAKRIELNRVVPVVADRLQQRGGGGDLGQGVEIGADWSALRGRTLRERGPVARRKE